MRGNTLVAAGGVLAGTYLLLNTELGVRLLSALVATVQSAHRRSVDVLSQVLGDSLFGLEDKRLELLTTVTLTPEEAVALGGETEDGRTFNVPQLPGDLGAIQRRVEEARRAREAVQN